jgi:AmmeMemoRadiSam system protein B
MNRKTIPYVATVIVLSAISYLAAGSRFFDPKRETVAVPVAPIETVKSDNADLRSYFNNRDDYERSFSKVGAVGRTDAVAGIVSHHFLAIDLITRFYAGIADDSVEHVIVVGPDHFRRLRGSGHDAVTTTRSWDTPYGTLDADFGMMGAISGPVRIPEDDGAFLNEHSIYTEVPFIRKVFPNADIVPVIVNNTDEYDMFIRLGEELRRASSGKTVLVVSSDFSHNVSAKVAMEEDGASISNLWNIGRDGLDGIHCDCRACMAVMLGYLGADDRYGFRLLENRNSADFGSPDKTVTSYISGYYVEQ